MAFVTDPDVVHDCRSRTIITPRALEPHLSILCVAREKVDRIILVCIRTMGIPAKALTS
jgi:hypothetical protein